MWILRPLLFFWVTRFFLIQLTTVSLCWLIFHLPMFCVYGSYAATVFFVNLSQWPSKEWLRIGVPEQARDALINSVPDKKTFATLREVLGSKKIEAVVVSNVRVDDTNDLADHVREQFFLKSVVYVMLVLAVAVATGFGSKKDMEALKAKVSGESLNTVPLMKPSNDAEISASSIDFVLPMDTDSKSSLGFVKEVDANDWFKALVLFIILVMGLLWDVAICFYQRKLNEKCHSYSVLVASEQH